MSTAAVSHAGGKVTTERFDVAYGDKLVVNKEDGKIEREPAVLSPDEAEKLSNENKFEGSVITASVDYPATFEALVELANTPVKDDDGKPLDQKEVHNEIVKLFVNGAKSKVMNRLRARLNKRTEDGKLAFDETKELTDGVLDLTPEITSGSKRVFLTEEQKMWKSIVFLPQTQKENVWRAYLTGLGKEFYIPAE